MQYIALDCETWLVGAEHPTLGRISKPAKPVCWGLKRKGKKGVLLAHKQATAIIRVMFESEDITLVFHNLAFDLPVIHKYCKVPASVIWRELEAGRIRDTMVRELLIGIATGDILKGNHLFSLSACLKRYTGEDKSHLKKGDDIWRLRYNELDGLPVDEYPQEAYDYAVGDAEDTLKVFYAQERHIHLFEDDEHFQTMMNWVAGSVDCTSPYVNADTVNAFEKKHRRIVERVQKPFIKANFLKWNKHRFKMYDKDDPRRGGWSENQQVFQDAVAMDYKRQRRAVPRTEPSNKFPQGQIKKDQETLLGCESKALRMYGRTAQDIKLVNAFVPALQRSAGARVAPSYNVLVSTGRMSCRGGDQGCNMQQLPRAPGARECFEAPEGFIICCLDFDSFEMFGLAQNLYWEFNEHTLLDALNNNQDPHLLMTATLIGETYADAVRLYHGGDEFVSNVRQLSKIVNFGAAGGMGADTFLSNMDEDVRETMTQLNPNAPLNEVMREILDEWKEQWGMRQYFQWVSQKTRGGRKFDYVHPWSGRKRGHVGYTDGCNLPFQGICADAFKAAAIEIVRECQNPKTYLGEKRVEVGALLHDEFMTMGPPETVRKWSGRVKSLMCEAAQQVMPDCKIRAGAEVTGRTWSKSGCSVEEFEILHREGLAAEHYLMAKKQDKKMTVSQYIHLEEQMHS